MIKPQTLKGFRDFLPTEARKRNYVKAVLAETFARYGFEPLETPTLEYEEILTGKYGDEGDKLMYRFEDNGDRRVAMRYDQTVPLARVVAQHAHELPFVFKRYQMQNVWRADNPQRGRYREFLQCDGDIIGSYGPTADAEVLACVSDCLKKLGVKDFEIRINHRSTFPQLMKAIHGDNTAEEEVMKELAKIASVSIDKLDKIGKEKVLAEMQADSKLQKHLSSSEASMQIMSDFLDAKPFTYSEANNQPLVINPAKDLEDILETAIALGVDEKKMLISPTLARGLDYYNGMIFEVIVKGYSVGSICGGGRYDGLINMFTDSTDPIPAVGFAFGFDRLLEAMGALKLFPEDMVTTRAIITTTKPHPQIRIIALELAQTLRHKAINTETFFIEDVMNSLDDNFIKYEKKLKEKLFKYTEQKDVSYAIFITDENAEKVSLRNLKTREEKDVGIEELIKMLAPLESLSV